MAPCEKSEESRKGSMFLLLSSRRRSGPRMKGFWRGTSIKTPTLKWQAPIKVEIWSTGGSSYKKADDFIVGDLFNSKLSINIRWDIVSHFLGVKGPELCAFQGCDFWNSSLSSFIGQWVYCGNMGFLPVQRPAHLCIISSWWRWPAWPITDTLTGATYMIDNVNVLIWLATLA